MKRTKKTPPRIEEGANARVAARTNTSSDQSIAHKSVSDKYPTYRQIGTLDGKAVYAPVNAPSRGLAIEEDHWYLRAMTPYEVVRFAAQLDRELSTFLLIAEEKALREVAEREMEADERRAEERAEEWYSEIGHGLAYGWPDVPRVV